MSARTQALGQFRRIVVPTDFSSGSSEAMKLAVGLAGRGTTITAVHVVDSFQYRYGTPESCNVKKQLAWTNAQLSMGNWLEEGKFYDCAKIVLEGDPAPAIVEFVAIDKSDLVVLATSGRLHLSRLLMGSVAEEIFREVPCAVLVLGPKCHVSPTPRLRRLLFATDLETHSLAALPRLSKLSRALNSGIWVLRAVPGGIPSHAEQSRIRKETRETVEVNADRHLRNRIKHIHVAFSPPVRAISTFAARSRADAIVLGIREGGELTRAATHVPWAIAHRIIARAACPVLTLRGRRLVCTDIRHPIDVLDRIQRSKPKQRFLTSGPNVLQASGKGRRFFNVCSRQRPSLRPR